MSERKAVTKLRMISQTALFRANPEIPRRSSISMTDEERRDAKDFRAHALKDGGMSYYEVNIDDDDDAASTSPRAPVLPVLSNPNHFVISRRNSVCQCKM
ncbi:hypothetical protein AG1IA_09716 [Rhizoctonia solani AG-1 IA]|uniref:Uncharacterized protein n=1 Tax=Thanatephorus cucumeris (strain AG1-IA) TaxID=983506 RepID=L8WHI9_THACA|nr:hypothetical protein AG1IA_09716 [Rhizoctonia solani AG-1 IA]